MPSENQKGLDPSILEKISLPEKERLGAGLVLILSGGMDSAVLLAYLKYLHLDIYALSFNYGSKHNKKELAKGKQLARDFGIWHKIVSLDFFQELYSSSLLNGGADIPDGHYEDESMKQTVVPFRNGIFLSVAVGLAESMEISHVALGSHSGDHPIYPDCRPDFTESFSRAAQRGTYQQISVLSPFQSMDKRDIADLGRGLNLDFKRTWTCYKGGEKHCGSCGACSERKYALRYDEGLDPTEYMA